MELTPGLILDGTVRSIAGYGAFIDLPDGKRGLVHISEVSSAFVNDIRQHLREGQAVRVRVLSVDERGRVALSIKKAQDAPKQDPAPSRREAPAAKPVQRPVELETFEDKLKQFMADSNSRIAGARGYERKTRSRRR